MPTGRWFGWVALTGVMLGCAACATEPLASVPCTPTNNLLFRYTPCSAPPPAEQVGVAPIQVFANDAQIPGPYQVMANIHLVDPGKYQDLSSNDAIAAGKEEARKVGANAIVIDKYDTIHSGIFSRGYELYARALRLGP